jgi:hypothetical protein
MNAVVFVKGDDREAFGFTAKLHDQYFIVTSQSIFEGQGHIAIIGMDGTKYPTTGDLFGDTDSDVAILRIPTPTHALEPLDLAATPIKVTDAFTMPGVEKGVEIVKQLAVHLRSIGPTSDEIFGLALDGLRGAPVIQNATGKVIGVALVEQTYGLIGPKSPLILQTHWVAVRLDVTHKWDKLDLLAFNKEGERLEQTKQLTALLLAAAQEHRLPANADNPEIQSALAQYTAATRATGARSSGAAARITAAQNLEAALQVISKKDLESWAGLPAGYHAAELKQQQATRTEIFKILHSASTAP